MFRKEAAAIFYNADKTGNIIIHVALKENGELQPIIAVPMRFSDRQLIMELLSTNNVVYQKIKTEEDKYILLFDGSRQRPYPSVMIWKYIEVGDDVVFIDAGHQDAQVIPYVVENYLRPQK